MKGIGNYSGAARPPAVSTERRLTQLAAYQGPRASVRFIDGTTYSMPAEPLRKMGLVVSDVFMLVTEYRGREIVGVRVERHAAARGAAPRRVQPKVMVRDGLKVTTRR